MDQHLKDCVDVVTKLFAAAGVFIGGTKLQEAGKNQTGRMA